MPLGAVSICQVSNQLSGKLVNVHASEVIELLSPEIEDGRAKDDRYVDTTAVEYFSVHDLPPYRGPLLIELLEKTVTRVLSHPKVSFRGGDALADRCLTRNLGEKHLARRK